MPTPISAVHAMESELITSDDCARCHGSLAQTMAEACIECHEPIGKQLEQASGFHGEVIKEAAERCGRCHIEHAGREFPLVGDLSFVLAGFASREDFDHPFADYDLDGAHDDLDCVACHEHADDTLLAKGALRFQGASQLCLDCHDESPHEDRMLRACVDCHGQEQPFLELATFVHDERFPLSGAHAVEDCKNCHEAQTQNSIEALASLAELPRVRRCESCHEPLHAESFLQTVLSQVEEPPADHCILCHTMQHAEFFDARANLDLEQHAASDFALDAPHDVQECVDCHKPELQWTDRFPGRAREDCAACHEDAHNGQFAQSTPFAQCSDCHLLDRFIPARFDQVEHAKTAFPLIGKHQAVGCYACHSLLNTGSLQREWHGTDSACASCHEDAHDEFFDERLVVLNEATASACSDCHEPTGFTDAADDFKADHERWTGFALDGAHMELECSECHPAAPEFDAFQRRFGRIAEVWGESPKKQQPCAACHIDPHEVDFNAPGQAQ
ncbi:MAG: hypothetical protein ACI8X5_000875, partial [Planctomycetota bacterium]